MSKTIEGNPWGNLAVRAKALTLLRDAHALEGDSISASKVLKHLNFTYAEFIPDRSLSEILGAVDHRTKTIHVNGEESRQRRNMTMAHEVGHIMLHPAENRIDLRRFTQDGLSDDEKLKEREANVFAYEFLMPFPAFISVYKKLGGKDIDGLARHFIVSSKRIGKRWKFLEDQIEAGRIEDFR